MPVPFRDITDAAPDAIAAYLRFVAQPGEGELQAALFLINSRGDPLEFCFTRASLAVGTLWEPGRAYQWAAAELCRSLFEAVKHTPDLLLVLEEEIPLETLARDLEVQLPVCLVAGSEVDPVAIQWIGAEPEEGSSIYDLVSSLRDRKLLLEPFRRAALGLEEAYPSQ